MPLRAIWVNGSLGQVFVEEICHNRLKFDEYFWLVELSIFKIIHNPIQWVTFNLYTYLKLTAFYWSITFDNSMILDGVISGEINLPM